MLRSPLEPQFATRAPTTTGAPEFAERRRLADGQWRLAFASTSRPLVFPVVLYLPLACCQEIGQPVHWATYWRESRLEWRVALAATPPEHGVVAPRFGVIVRRIGRVAHHGRQQDQVRLVLPKCWLRGLNLDGQQSALLLAVTEHGAAGRVGLVERMQAA